MTRRAAAAVAACFALLCAPAAAGAETFTVTSFDGTPINVNFFGAGGGAQPTVLLGPGYSSGGDTNPNSASSDAIGSVGAGPLLRAGYNVVTWDPRGFGRSGGTVQIDSPEHEARDVQAIIDVIAKRPDVLLDAPGDPRVGMAGASYGGGIQLNTAQREPRVDAITPTIAWHSLLTSLFKDSTLKAGWGLVLCAAGESRGLAEGLLAPGGPQTGAHDPAITRVCTNGTATGAVPTGEDAEFFRVRGPGELVRKIRVPTLLVQGTVDTLFTLREAMDNHALLEQQGVPLKMLWFCGGHGGCTTGSGTPLHVEKRILAWLDRHLRGRSVDTGPAFEWLADDAVWRSAAGFPLPLKGTVRASGSGTLALQPAASSGAAVAATPAPPGTAFELTFDALPAEGDVLGEPRLKLTYSGTATAPDARVFAQIVDAERGRVAGNLVTPVPLTLDGQEHTIERPLEPIALRGAVGKRYRLQLVPSTTLYYPQRNAGLVTIKSAEATLPVADAAAAKPSAAEQRGRSREAGCGTTPPRGFRSVTVRGGRSLRLRVLRHVARGFRVELLRGGRRVATVSRRPGSFRFARRVRPGRYTVRAVMPLPRGRRDVRQATARYERGRWTVGAVRYAGSC